MTYTLTKLGYLSYSQQHEKYQLATIAGRAFLAATPAQEREYLLAALAGQASLEASFEEFAGPATGHARAGYRKPRRLRLFSRTEHVSAYAP